MAVKAAFIDLDGSLIVDVPYNVDPEKVEFMPGALAGLRRLFQASYLNIIVTNKAGVACGFYTERDLVILEKHLRIQLDKHGIVLDGFFYCPHYPEGQVPRFTMPCCCQKPDPGLLLLAKDVYNIDMSRSWMIGDVLDDIEAGKRAGCHTILLDHGHEHEWRLDQWRQPDHKATSIEEAAQIILGT